MGQIEKMINILLPDGERDNDACENCRINKGTDELHTCPFSEEIWNNHEADCNCCDDCSYQCAMDI